MTHWTWTELFEPVQQGSVQGLMNSWTGPRVRSKVQEIWPWTGPNRTVATLLPLSPSTSHPSQSHPPSTSTWLPGWFDKHLDDKHVLKQLKTLGSLVGDIAAVTNAAVLKVHLMGHTLPPNSKGSLFPEALMKSWERHASKVMRLEKDLVTHFSHMADYWLPHSSNLAIFPSYPEWVDYLKWSMQPNQAMHAIADDAL
jgi:hypothetical protein